MSAGSNGAEYVRRVRHREHVELVGHDERGDVDLFVDDELADFPELGNVRRRQDGFKLVPALAGVVDADRPDIDSVHQRR
jgi:hypothetical protein